MTEFVVKFNIDNAAFADNCSGECARILRALADTIENETPVEHLKYDCDSIHLQDVNGNKVGAAWVSI